MRPDEWHITVTGDQHHWRGFCTSIGIKPLRIELSTFEVQLMCAISGSWVAEEYGARPDAAIHALQREMMSRGFTTCRVKHELQAAAHEVIPDAMYYECHIKLDGPFDPQAAMASRDLFREDRWYITRRELAPFDPAAWVRSMRDGLRHFSSSRAVIHSYEYEAAVLDTNPALDARWVRN